MRRNKYGNHRVVYDGIQFDSKKEVARYRDLCLLQRAGEISGLTVREKFALVPKQEGERSVNYYADFSYRNKGGELVVEDVKCPASKTPTYRIKRKLMLFVHGIKIVEI